MDDIFRETPAERAQRQAIAATVLPSDYIPAVGEHFRIRFATIADRSYLDVIWKCLGHQDGAVACEPVTGGHVYGDPRRIFVIGDVLFYQADELLKALRAADA